MQQPSSTPTNNVSDKGRKILSQTIKAKDYWKNDNKQAQSWNQFMNIKRI